MECKRALYFRTDSAYDLEHKCLCFSYQTDRFLEQTTVEIATWSVDDASQYSILTMTGSLSYNLDRDVFGLVKSVN